MQSSGASLLYTGTAYGKAWPKGSGILAGWSPLGVCAGSLQGVKEVQVAGLVVLQRNQWRRQRAQQLLILCEEGVIGVCGMTLDSRFSFWIQAHPSMLSWEPGLIHEVMRCRSLCPSQAPAQAQTHCVAPKDASLCWDRKGNSSPLQALRRRTPVLARRQRRTQGPSSRTLQHAAPQSGQSSTGPRPATP